jgi:hypothetical protein
MVNYTYERVEGSSEASPEVWERSLRRRQTDGWGVYVGIYLYMDSFLYERSLERPIWQCRQDPDY